MQQVREIIEQLGGATELAAELARIADRPLSRDAVYNWPARGIPAAWLVPLQEALKARQVEMSVAQLMALSGPRRAA